MAAYCSCCDTNVGSREIKMVTGPAIEELKKTLNSQQLTKALGYVPHS